MKKEKSKEMFPNMFTLPIDNNYINTSQDEKSQNDKENSFEVYKEEYVNLILTSLSCSQSKLKDTLTKNQNNLIFTNSPLRNEDEDSLNGNKNENLDDSGSGSINKNIINFFDNLDKENNEDNKCFLDNTLNNNNLNFTEKENLEESNNIIKSQENLSKGKTNILNNLNSSLFDDKKNVKFTNLLNVNWKERVHFIKSNVFLLYNFAYWSLNEMKKNVDEIKINNKSLYEKYEDHLKKDNLNKENLHFNSFHQKNNMNSIKEENHKTNDNDFDDEYQNLKKNINNESSKEKNEEENNKLDDKPKVYNFNKFTKFYQQGLYGEKEKNSLNNPSNSFRKSFNNTTNNLNNKFNTNYGGSFNVEKKDRTHSFNFTLEVEKSHKGISNFTSNGKNTHKYSFNQTNNNYPSSSNLENPQMTNNSSKLPILTKNSFSYNENMTNSTTKKLNLNSLENTTTTTSSTKESNLSRIFSCSSKNEKQVELRHRLNSSCIKSGKDDSHKTSNSENEIPNKIFNKKSKEKISSYFKNNKFNPDFESKILNIINNKQLLSNLTVIQNNNKNSFDYKNGKRKLSYNQPPMKSLHTNNNNNTKGSNLNLFSYLGNRGYNGLFKNDSPPELNNKLEGRKFSYEINSQLISNFNNKYLNNLNLETTTSTGFSNLTVTKKL